MGSVEAYANFTDSQLRLLHGANDDDERDCLIKFWATATPHGKYCNSTWDSFICWPSTPAGEVASIACQDIIQELNGSPFGFSNASAYRICNEKGEWLWGNWTNYTECMNLIDLLAPIASETTATVVSYIGFIGSIISLVSLLIAFFIFCYFKSLQCSRLSVHKNLVFSFILRFALMIIVTEPSVSGRRESYITVEWLCKSTLALKLYSMLSNVNWMFVEGFYLHSRITVSVFNSEAPFGFFYFVGWGLPSIYVTVWVVVMETKMTTYCWLGYSKMPYIWILTAPMSIALLANLLFLINIVRILVSKLRANNTLEAAQVSDGRVGSVGRPTMLMGQRTAIPYKNRNVSGLVATRKAIKATAVLFPLLGTTNLLFFVNPNDDGNLEDAYFIVNAILQSSQGIFVSVLYCFLNSEVCVAIRKKYVRFMLRRNPNSQRFNRRKYSRTSSFFLSQYEAPDQEVSDT